MSALCRILMLGQMAVVQGDRTITRFRTRKTAALLAYLAYYRDQSHSREQLVDLFWPEADPNPARSSLSVAVWSLRHQLEPPGVPSGAVLIADRFNIQIRPETVTTDVADFNARLAAISQAKTKSERILCLKEAVTLYAGEFLPGFYESWITREQVVLAEQFVEATCALTALLEAVGEREAAISHARRAVAVDPLREEPRRELMRLYAALGEPHAALEQYRELEQAMRKELRESPSASTRRLARDVERLRAASPHSPAAPEATPAGVASKPSPVHHPRPTGTVTVLLFGEGGHGDKDSGGNGGAASRSGDPRRKTLRREFRLHAGREILDANSTLAAFFGSALDALGCAAACQRALAALLSTAGAPATRLRVALHTGDMHGNGTAALAPLLARAGRILAAAHPGQTLCSEATTALLRHDPGGSCKVRDLGTYRLNDYANTERLFQIDYPEMAAEDFPPPLAEQAFTNRLPLQLTRFFGRQQELAQLVELLTPAHDAARLVTLCGPPGSGKTRLAQEVAARLMEPLAGAVWYVPLADLQEPERLADTIRAVLGVEHQPVQSALEAIVERLGMQPALIVLDNFEHLVAGAATVAALLAKAPEIRFLVTSQHHLGLEGEREVNVAPLPLPVTADAPEVMAQVPSVQLFVDRAQAVLPDFQLTAATAAGIAELCRKLDGIPLAIELAASRMHMLSTSRLLEQLNGGITLLASRRRDVEARHRTLRAALEWSHGLLRPELQQFLTCLAVFRGGWTIAAATFVCEEPHAADCLEELRECSLVAIDTDGPEPRYRMLEMVREFAAEHLARTGKEFRIRQRHLEFFLDLAEEQPLDEAGSQHGEWIAAIEADYDNLRQALSWCRQPEAPDGSGLRLAVALKRFWMARGHWQEALSCLEDLLAAAPASARPAMRAAALRTAGSLALGLENCAKAKRFYEESRVLAETGSPLDLAAALRGLARVAHATGALLDARALLGQSLALCRDRGARPLEARCLADLAIVAACEGRFGEAKDLLGDALEIYRECAAKRGQARVLHALAVLSRSAGESERALDLAEEALELNCALGDGRWEATNLHLIGSLAHQAGDCERAESCYERAAAIQRSMGCGGNAANGGRTPLVPGTERLFRHERGMDGNLESPPCSPRTGVECALDVLERLCPQSCRFDPTRPCHCEFIRVLRGLVAERGDVFVPPPVARLLPAGVAAPASNGDFDVPLVHVAHLVGAAAAVIESRRIDFPPYAQQCLDRTVSALRAGLGDAAFAAAASAGRTAALG